MSGIPAAEAVLARAAPLIREAEGFSSRPYRDAIGKATIGWGSTHYADGRAVTINDAPIDEAAGEALLQTALARLWSVLAPHLARPPGINQAAALLSLAYNIGAGALLTSLLLAKFNRGDSEGAAAEFLRWDKARIGEALRVLPGLAARRKREQALFLTPDTNSFGKEET